MKKIIACLALVAMVGIAKASIIAYEPFNYTSGTFANNTPATGTGLTGNWTCGGAGTIGTGLTYSGLTVANNALSSGGSRQFVSLSTPLSSGTKWISFILKASGNMGGNIDGVFFPNANSTCLWFGYGLGPFSGTQGQLGLGSMTTAGNAALGATSLKQVGLGTYANSTLIVLKIDFDTSGVNDTVTVYVNPVANAAAPGVTAVGTNSTFDVGTISKIGLNVQGGATITVDEIRIGDTYGDVVAFVPPPSVPTNLTATPGVNSVGLSWDPTSGATGYKVLRGTSTGVYTVTTTAASNTYLDNTTVGGTTYFYVVQATNSSGVSANSSEVNATPTIALPSAPTGLTATGTNGAVNLSWNAGAGAASYNVKRSTTSGAEVIIANAGTTSYSDTAVVNGTTYFYEVSSTNNAGESANSSEASATPNVPPAAPTGLTATAGTNQVALSWTGSAGAVSYNVKRSTTSGSGYSTIGTMTDPTTAYTDSTAVKFTQYFYVISAVNAYGEGANSSPEATATPLGSYGPSAYESFNYATGTLANNTPSTANGFAGNWSVSAFPTIVAGLTYTNLPTTANAYQHAAAGAQTTENLATPLSSGTKFISFLFKGSGNSGGDTVGVFFKGNNANSLFAGFRVPDTGITTGFGLGTVNTTTLGIATGLGSVVNISNSTVHLIVMEIDFNTSGVNDTVRLWIDPPAGVITPGVAANVVNSTFDVGTISAFGINITGGYNPIVDEIRVGDLYGDVVGYGAVTAPTIPTTVSISAAQGERVSWNASSANSYQPQKSADGSTWTNFGGLFNGNAVSSVYESSPAPYYRVLEFLPGGPGPDVMVNGSFETSAGNNVGAANWNGPANTSTASQYVTNQYGALLPTDGASMLVMEGTNGTGSVVSSDSIPISGGLTYKLLFDTANPVKINGGSPQYRIQYFNAGNAYISDTGFGSTAAVGSNWTTISNNFAAPANAATMQIQFLEAVGGGANWVTLFDNVKFSALATISGTNILSTTLQPGAVFTGTVISNGVATATLASGTITFLTNNAALSTNTVALGSATSATAILTPPYTVKAIYSGDSTYIGSTNTLTVSNASAAVTLGNLSQTYDGTAKSATAITTPSGLTVNFSYNGSANAPTNAGTYQVIGNVSDPVYVGSATNNLVIAKAAATVALGSLSQTYDGTAKSATAITTPPGLAVSFTYDGSPSAPINVGTYAVIGTVVDNNYFGAATNNLVISSGISTTPTNMTVSFSGNQLTLSWPADHLGWLLQAQTNSLSVGISTNWVDVPGSSTNTQSVINIDPANPSAFFRLRSP
ncbi:MAG: Fibronectin type domain protein [Pedosphaera sp.]|nr:Fibronectin type domain protein [Pedosphaera sp.]